jgi:hypothetical protein
VNDIKRRLRLQDIKRGGNDGFVCIDEPCGCGLADAFPCGDGPFLGCRTAKAVIVDDYHADYCDLAMPGDTIYVEAHRVDEWR